VRIARVTNRRTHTNIVTAVLTITLALGAVACGDDDAPHVVDRAQSAPTPTTVAAPTRPSNAVDALVRIDHGHLHLRCAGAGSATVLLIPGWDHDGGYWSALEDGVDEHARVCSYEKFGTGTSDAPAATQTFDSQATDLHALLDAAGEPGPYVVVGHSFGGAEAVTFASKYADEVRGLMLLDASPTNWPATVCSVPAYASGCAVMRDPALDAERLDVFAAFEEVASITSLGDLPMTVITAAHRNGSGLTPAELERVDAVWAEGVDRWATLSSSSRVISVEETGHDIHVDQSQLVIDEVRKLLP
jgi:pimeloyl-ACP methyl ester carboxylesterase